jgi:hypothetical protein
MSEDPDLRYGYLKKTGEFLVRPELLDATPFNEGLAAIWQEEESAYIFIDTDGQRAFRQTAFRVSFQGFTEGLVPVFLAVSSSEGRWGYIDTRGEVVITPQFSEARNFCQGLAAVRLAKSVPYGFIDRTGQIVTEPQFGTPMELGGGLAAAVRILQKHDFFTPFEEMYSKYAFVNPEGQLITQPIFDYVYPSSSGLVSVKIGEKWGCIDTRGELVIIPQFDEMGFYCEGLLRVRWDDKIGYIDRQQQVVIPFQPLEQAQDFSEGLAAFKPYGQGWGYMDRKGQVVVPPQFQEAYKFSEGLAVVYLDDKSGYIDPSGRLVIPPQFQIGFNFHEGAAKVKVDGLYGYIDKTGRWIAEPQFHGETQDFHKGLALVAVQVS